MLSDMDPNDDISITSTESTVDSEKEYLVKQILAQGKVKGTTQFLIEWEGYPLGRATWEPRRNIPPSLLAQWSKTRIKQREGKIPKFDIDEWRVAIIEKLRARCDQLERRNRERQRRGLEIEPLDRTFEDLVAEVNATPEDQPKATGVNSSQSALQAPQASLQETVSDVPASNQRSRRSSIDALFSDSESEIEIDALTAACDPAGEEMTTPNKTDESVSADKAAFENKDQESSSLQQSFAEIAIDTVPKNLASPVLSTRGPYAPDDGSGLGSDAMDIDDESDNMSPTTALSQSPNENSSKMSDAVSFADKTVENQGIDRLTKRDTAAEEPLHQPKTPTTIEENKNRETNSLPSLRPNKPEKRVSFSLKAPTKQPSTNRAEVSLFVPDRSHNQATPTSKSKSSSSTGKTPIISEENPIRERSDLQDTPKTCIIGSTKLACSFHMASRPDKSQLDFYEKFADQETFEFSHICTAQDLLRQLIATELSTGFWLLGTASSHLQAKELASVADCLRASSFGLLCRGDGLCIVVYPCKSPDWQEHPLPASPTPENHLLRFLAFMPALNFPPNSMALEFDLKYQSGFGMFDKYLYQKLLPSPDQTAKTQNIPDSFFLIFPSSAKPEENLLCRWLRTFNKNCEIRSCIKPGHWAKFIEGSRGVIILHQDCVQSLHRLPRFHTLLHRRNEDYKFWIFRLPFCSPVSEPKSMEDHMEQVGIALDWVFPPGVAILAPPSFFISQPLQAYSFLKWAWQNFASEASIYRHGKLAVCYGMDDWLLSLALEKSEANFETREPKNVLETRMRTFVLMKKLLERDTEELTAPIASAPVYIDGNDEQSLVNWFGCWSISHIDQFRKFHVLCSDNHQEHRFSRYINRYDLRDSFARAKSPKGTPIDTERAKFELVSSDSTQCLTTYMKGLSSSTHAGPWIPLVICPWPVQRHGGELRNGDASDWVNYFAKYLSRTIDGTKSHGRGNTQFALFYIADDDNSQTDADYQRSRHPWLAFLRPMELFRKPWTHSELLIWDYRLRDATRESTTIAESELSQSQRNLITEVINRFAKINLPLGQVWAGGFSSSKSLSNPLDITLEWSKAMLANIKSWLPLNHSQLESRGWSEVRPRGSESSASHSPARTGKAESSDAVEADEDLSGSAPRIVFSPPVSGSTPSKPYVNRLYQWAMATRVPNESEYTFVPTLEWYQEQQEMGRGFEHIRVASWKAFFQHYNIEDPEK